MVTNNTIKFDENLLSNLLFVEFRPSLLVNDIFEREESTSERDSVILSTPSLFHPSSSLPARAPERKTSVERDPTQPKHFHAESFAQGEVENEKMRGLFDGGWKGVEIGPMDYRLNREGQDRLTFESCSCFARCNRCLQLL